MTNLNLSNIKNICIILLAVVIIILLSIQGCSRQKIKEQNININALTDSLTVSKNKCGEAIYSKNILLADYNTLKQINSNLTQEIEKGTKKNLAEINKLNMIISGLTDSISLLQGTLIKQDSGTYIYEFIDSTAFRVFKNEVLIATNNKPDSVILRPLKNDIYANLVIKKYVTEDKINLQVYSNNPAVTFTDIEGSIIDISQYQKIQKKKRFSLGVGLTTGVGYTRGFTTKQSDIGSFVGVGFTLSYNLISF